MRIGHQDDVTPTRRSRLKLILIGGDTLAAAAAYAASLWLSPDHGQPAWRVGAAIAAAATVGVWAMHVQGLHLARISTVRAIELSRTAKAVGITALAMIVVDRVAHLGVRVREVLPAAFISLVLLCVWRSIYRSSLAGARIRGRHVRRMLVIGSGDDAARLVDICATHPEAGFAIAGVVGDRADAARHGLADFWLAPLDDAERAIADHEVSGVFVSPGLLAPDRMKELLAFVRRRDLHVHLMTGVSGLDSRRIRLLPLSHEPLLYLEPPALSAVHAVVKRVSDVIAASIILLLVSPMLALIALAIKIHDGGPVLFVQERIGRDGRAFGLLKFRSMCVDADRRLAELRSVNERSGPLFKMVSDPRVTRIGRFLRESSLDELPQLWNVLRGEMSLVGPRPALPAEVAVFSEELRTREKVRPGITGLWQVEARDNPSFSAYQRLDLFYVENWSLLLDLMIVLGTIEQTVARLARSLHRTPSPAHTPSAIVSPNDASIVTVIEPSAGRLAG